MTSYIEMNTKSICLSIVVLCLFILSQACNTHKKVKQNMVEYDNYPSLWANYNVLISKGRNQDALLTLDSIFIQAKSDKNDPQILKVFFKRSVANNFQEDAIEKQINYVNNNQNALSTETAKAIYSSYLAELYLSLIHI